MITVSVKLFAAARDLTGVSEKLLTLEDDAVALTVLDHFVRTNPRFLEWKKHTRVAVNSEYVDLDYRLHDGDEVAIIPPVSGG